MNDVRKRLEATRFRDLEGMMETYAQAAAELARTQFQRTLDFTPESVESLDEILVLVGESPETDIEFEVRLWGSYLGEVLRRRYAGVWEMTTYPGAPQQAEEKSAAPAAVPAVEVRGSRLFPMIKVYRRLTMGEEDDLRSFVAMVVERLGKPAQVN
jgi:hypothetical protein